MRERALESPQQVLSESANRLKIGSVVLTVQHTEDFVAENLPNIASLSLLRFRRNIAQSMRNQMENLNMCLAFRKHHEQRQGEQLKGFENLSRWFKSLGHVLIFSENSCN